VPNGPEATAAVREAFFRMTDYPPEDSLHVPTGSLDVGGGRMLHVPKSLKGVAVFSFKRLCGEARGAADYLAIARNYHTVILVGIPRLGPDQRNEAARFVTLIDALYEHKVNLIATADAEPAELYPAATGASSSNVRSAASSKRRAATISRWATARPPINHELVVCLRARTVSDSHHSYLARMPKA
jgi:predicted ATPase